MTSTTSPPAKTAPVTPPRLPLIIGIVGSRDLGGHDVELGKALVGTLKKFTKDFPNSPLMIVTTPTIGAGWLAVRAAAKLANDNSGTLGVDPHITLVAVLATAADRQDANVSRLFKPGKVTSSDSDVPDPKEPRPITIELAPLAGTANAALHAEQAGLYIADNCHLLISITADGADIAEVGSAQRIAHYKATGGLPPSAAFDAAMAAVKPKLEPSPALPLPPALNAPVQRLRAISTELHQASEPADWLAHRTGHVWRLPLAPPHVVQHITGHALTLRPTRRDLSAFDAIGPLDQPLISPASGEQAALRHFKEVEAFNARMATNPPAMTVLDDRPREQRTAEERRKESAEQKAYDAEPDAGHRGALRWLCLVRSSVSGAQRAMTRQKDVWLEVMAVAFVIAVGVFAIYTTDYTSLFAATLYVVAILAAIFVLLYSRSRKISAVHQDYRVVAEALRVQIAWRISGMVDRASSNYIPGAAVELKAARTGLATINAVVALRFRPQTRREPNASVALARETWTRHQMNWFAKKYLEKFEEAKLASERVAILFGTATGTVAGLAAFKWDLSSPLALAGFALAGALSLIPFVRQFPAPGAIFKKEGWTTLLARRTKGMLSTAAPSPAPSWWQPISRLAQSMWWRTMAPLAWSLAPPLLSGAATFVGLSAFAMAFGKPAVEAYVPFIGVAIATLNGAAGAFAYLLHKSAIEPEARNYAEMREVFALAEHLLDAAGDDLPRQQTILRETGRVALAENAFWLRAHRERPIEPITSA